MVFASFVEARTAGYRPCRVCRPEKEERYRSVINRAWAQMFPDPDDRPTRYAVVADVNSTSPDNLFQVEIVAVLE